MPTAFGCVRASLGGMADDTHREDASVELLATPPGARMLTTLGMAKKTPGWCACGEHRDDEHAEHDHDDQG